MCCGPEPDDREQLLELGAHRVLRHDAVQQHRLGDELADGVARVERVERVLEDHLHLLPQVAQGAGRQPRDGLAVDLHAPARGLLEPQHAAPDGRLAGAALADERERLAALDRDRDVVGGDELGARADAGPQVVDLAQPADLEQGHQGPTSRQKWHSV